MHGNEFNAKKYYWLKLDRHFFNNGRIKKLRKLAGGDTYTIIYLKMLLLSIEFNGILIYEGIEDEFFKEIALKLDEEELDCQVTINYLLSQGLLVETNEQNFHFPDISGVVGSETKSNVYKSQKRLGLEKFQPNSNQIPIEKEIDIELEIDKEKDINNIKEKDDDVIEKEKSSSSSKGNLKSDLDTFLEKFGIMLDDYGPNISEINFERLTKRFEESEWLKKNITSFKKVCELYPKIISGYYKEYNRKPRDNSYQILKTMMEEAEAEEKSDEDKQGGTMQ